MYDNDDTIRGKKTAAGNTHDNQRSNHTAAKAAAAGVIGAALGVGGAYAMGGSEPQPEPQPAEQPSAAPKEQPRHEEPQAKQQEEPRQEEQAKHEEQTHHEEPVRHTEPQTEHHGPQPSPTPTSDDNGDDAIVITETYHSTDENGTPVLIAKTSINGRNAIMMAEEDGHVRLIGIDDDNSGHLSDDEIVNVSDRNLYITGNSVEMREPEEILAGTPETEPEPEVKVIAVENDVEMDGHTVDVAAVSMGGQNVIFVDENQNGEVDVAMADINSNGHIDDGEAANVADQHIMMPTADDVVQPDVAQVSHDTTDDLPDYSNDADITMYDV